MKREKGSIAIFVLVALLFMSGFLLILYASNVNKSKAIQEQFNIINDIYAYNGGDEGAYDKAYTNLRKKNKQLMTISSEGQENTAVLELTKTFNESISNYRIYGDKQKLGNYIADTTDTNYGKYQISIKITGQGGESLTTDLFLDEALGENEYIDYKSEKVVRSDGIEEIINLPKLSTYEDYTKIEVLTEVAPSKIEVEYMGYTLE